MEEFDKFQIIHADETWQGYYDEGFQNNIKDFLSQSLDRLQALIVKSLPKKRGIVDMSFSNYEERATNGVFNGGYNQAIKEVLDLLK